MTPPAVRVQVDPRLCEGHALCLELAPDLFDLDDDDFATVTDEFLDEKHWAAARAAAAACPRQAITMSPDDTGADKQAATSNEGDTAVGEYGPLAQKVIEYQDTVRQLVLTAKTADDFAPMGEFVALDEFERIGTFLEVQNWQQYAEMLLGWAQSVDSFDTTVRRVTEAQNLVYFEVEERHFYGENVHVVNSLSVFEFNDDRKIRHLDVYLQMQQPG